MVASSMFWLRVAACFYAVGLLHSILLLLRRKQSLYGVALWAFQVGAPFCTAFPSPNWLWQMERFQSLTCIRP